MLELKLEGETEHMCVWTKKRGSMNAVVLMATPCPKSLHGNGEKWIAVLIVVVLIVVVMMFITITARAGDDVMFITIIAGD